MATRSPTSSKATNSSPYCLPAGWNTSQDVYALQYHHPGQRKLVLVKIIVIDTQLLINAMVREFFIFIDLLVTDGKVSKNKKFGKVQ